MGKKNKIPYILMAIIEYVFQLFSFQPYMDIAQVNFGMSRQVLQAHTILWLSPRTAVYGVGD
mgnify:CR=1 FL=1